METSKDRVLQFVDFKGVSRRKFYEKCGLSNAFLDKVGSIGADKLESISIAYPDLNVEWIVTGKGPMIKSNSNESHILEIGIPLIPIEAIAGKQPGELVIKEADVESRYIVPEFSRADFLIRVKGSSMYPKYSAGDLLACKKVDKASFLQWNKTYVIDTTQGILVKRIVKSDKPGIWILRSDNKDYQDIEVRPDVDVYHINLVVGVIREE